MSNKKLREGKDIGMGMKAMTQSKAKMSKGKTEKSMATKKPVKKTKKAY